MELKNLIRLFSDNDCHTIYIKELSPNDNSKNQVYLGGSFEVLNILPSGSIFSDKHGIRKRETLKSRLNFYWTSEDGIAHIAPNAQLILYPDYPEVRFSGFLQGCKNAPSDLMNSRLPGRILFLGVTHDKSIFGFIADPASELANEYHHQKGLEQQSVFRKIIIENGIIGKNKRGQLLNDLKQVHNKGWICSKRLNSQSILVPCLSPNCGGYTLEAELNISSNSAAEPDYLGYEIKQFRVPNFNSFGSKAISLMDHSPNGGYFVEYGVRGFIKKFGYNDKKGDRGRMNFGGIYRNSSINKLTALKLIIKGFDGKKNVITQNDGYVALVDENEEPAATWSFTSIIEHWKNKHPQACYIPSRIRKNINSECKQEYYFGNNIILGTGTDVTLFLKELYNGSVYYDPGIKLEIDTSKKNIESVKVRSLFRTKPIVLKNLYHQTEVINLNEI